jgi:HAD superfamily hydrolase (TIGR01509 family)
MPQGLVIFDCDGVLVDSEPISIDVLLDVITEAHGTITKPEAYARFLGKSLGTVSAILQDDYGLTMTAATLETMRLRLFARFRDGLQPIQHVARALDGLAQPFCVASSSQPDRIRLCLEVADLLPRFEPNIFSATMVRNGKPAPDLFLHAANTMGVRPGRCLVVEDSPAGVMAAQRAGMPVVGFVGGSHAGPAGLRDALEKLRPDAIFDDMLALPGLVRASLG